MSRGSPVPTAVKILQGTMNTTRESQKMMAKPIKDIPTPPEVLNKLGREFWYRQLYELNKIGLISDLDLPMFEIYCNEMSRYWEIQEILKDKTKLILDPNKSESILALMAAGRNSSMIAYKIASQFGFTPVSRSKINVREAGGIKKKDIFDLFIR